MNYLISAYKFIKSFIIYDYENLIGKRIVFDDEKELVVGKEGIDWIYEKNIHRPYYDEKYLRIMKTGTDEEPIFYYANLLKGRVDIHINIDAIVTNIEYE